MNNIIKQITDAIKAEDFDDGVVYIYEEHDSTVIDTEDTMIAAQVLYDLSQILDSYGFEADDKLVITANITRRKSTIKLYYGRIG